MTAFLHEVAAAMLAEQGTALQDVAVVLPSRRAGLYLRKWLAGEAGRLLWSPQVFTLGGFLEERSGLRPLAPEELLLEGYAAYRQTEGAGARSLDDFLQWGGTMLADISEADAHLIPLANYYRDLRSWEEIEWTFNDDPLSQGQQRMVRFWAMAGRVHEALNAHLLKRGAGTTGLIERTAAGKAVAEGGQWQAVWFAGLNALTRAQGSVLRQYKEAGLARFAWDADHYYFDRPEQEAGQYLRKAVATFGAGTVPVGNGLQGGNLRLRTVRTPNDVSQAWCAAELLRNFPKEERDRTAVVLADESLLQPLLEALPADLGPLNVTMGLPMAQLPVGSYIGALHRLHADARPGLGFFHADVERFLGHPFLRQGPLAAAISKVLSVLGGSNRSYLPGPFLGEILRREGLSDGAAPIFTEVRDARSGMPVVTTQALALARQATEGDAFATEQLYQAALILQRIRLLLAQHAEELGLKAWTALFNRLLGTARIGLFGEPLAGVQVMGMLEARALDPKRLIVLGAQEGSLPSGAARSFIPFELRRAHGMPLREGQDAVQAYNFLRMLQRADEAVLIWTEGAEPTGPSRFILQLEQELFKERPDRIETIDARIPMPAVQRSTVRLQKDEAVLSALRKRLERGLSPSALGDWLRCPLDFHFKHVLGLRQAGAPGARIGPDVLGEALHNAMEAAYAPSLGKPLEAGMLLEAADVFEETLMARLAGEMDADQLAHGQPLLQVRMAVHAAQRFLRNEARAVENGAVITPIAQELELNMPLEGAASAIGSPVFIRGRLDRVDRKDRLLRVLDLKTGKVRPEDLKIMELRLEGLKGSKRYAVQLMTYAWLHLMQHPEVDALQAGLLPLQLASSSEPLLLGLPSGGTITREHLPAIGQLLTDAVCAMMDTAAPIEHDPRSTYCAFCLKE